MSDEQPKEPVDNTFDSASVADENTVSTENQSGKPEQPGVNPELLASAKSHYGFTDDQLSSFDSDDALAKAMTEFDNQMLQPPQGYQQPSNQPAPPPAEYQQQGYDQTPQQEYQQPQQPAIPGFPELKRELMDDTQYEALTALQNQYQSMQAMVQQMGQQMQQAETDRYIAKYTGHIDNLNDGRFTQQNPNYENNLYQLLSTVENLNYNRMQRGLPLMSEADAVQAAHRQFVQYNGTPVGMGDQFIGQPATSKQELANGDSKALRTIGKYIDDVDDGLPSDEELLMDFPG
tara:strand:+ start:136 stop:1005 length:870 start_codon:yes stop_codon:yes gene_type:complete